MNELQIFQNREFGQVRVVNCDGEPWFVARDIAVALGYASPADAVRVHCKKVKDSNVGVSQTVPSPKIIPESDVYRLIMRSNLPSAERFQDWLVEEVLPALRKTGGYMLAGQDETPEAIMARAVLVAQDTIRRLESKAVELETTVEELKPKALFADSVASSDTLIRIGDLAKILRQNGVDIGEKRLFVWMRANSFLMKHGFENVPTQRAMNLGLFRIIETTITVSGNASKIRTTTKVTGKGQRYFVEKFLSEGDRQEGIPA